MRLLTRFTLLFLPFTSVTSLINPILPGWNPDPSILHINNSYFLTTSTFEYFPAHPIYHSEDLTNWTLISHALTRPSQLSLFGTPSDAGAWAPTLRWYKGRFYLTSTVRYVYTTELRVFPRSFYVWTEDIFDSNGGWSDPVYFDFLGYDVDLFFDPFSDDVYATYSSINNASSNIYSIYQSKISLPTGTSLTPSKLIFTGTLPDNSTARPEGPHIYFINSTYYLLIAEGGTDIHHRSTIQRGPSPEGPWESYAGNPVLFNGMNLSLGVQDTGHADMVQGDDGKWWGVALGVRPQGGNFSRIQLGRETFLFPITWTADGWPLFNNGQPLSEYIPDILTDEPHVSTFIDYFNETETGITSPSSSYYFLRTPYKPFHTIISSSESSESSPQHLGPRLRLYPSPYAPGDRDSPSLILRKQTSYNEHFSTVLESFTPPPLLPSTSSGINDTGIYDQGQGPEAGITIFYSDSLHNDIAIVGGILPSFLNVTSTLNLNHGQDQVLNPTPESTAHQRYILTRLKTHAKQIGPWALTSTNNTLSRVMYTPLRSLDAPVRFVVRASGGGYKLGFEELVTSNPSEEDPGDGEDDEGVTWTAEVDAGEMSIPPAGGFFFKGASFGIYNTGNGKTSLLPADFRYWKQVPLEE